MLFHYMVGITFRNFELNTGVAINAHDADSIDVIWQCDTSGVTIFRVDTYSSTANVVCNRVYGRRRRKRKA